MFWFALLFVVFVWILLRWFGGCCFCWLVVWIDVGVGVCWVLVVLVFLYLDLVFLLLLHGFVGWLVGFVF